jgi:hypothetical protein
MERTNLSRARLGGASIRHAVMTDAVLTGVRGMESTC